jgi:hypothetical protein
LKPAMERLRKACQLSLRDWMVLGHAWVLFLVIELGLSLLSFRSLLTLCRRYSRCGQLGSSSASIERLAWLTAVAGRCSPVRTTCLRQALVLSILLERRGIPTSLRIGVSRQAGELAAHAWLEQNGRIIPGVQGRDGFEPLLPEVSAP